MRLSGCDHIRIHVGKRSRHAFGSLRANSYSHRFRFDSLLTTSFRCLLACTLQAQAVPAARPEVVLAPREVPARVMSSVFAAHVRFLVVRLRISSSVVGSVCVCLSARLLRRVAPRFSCPFLFVGLVLVRARCVIASGTTIDEIASIALLFLLVLSLTAWPSPRHPAQRRPAIVFVPFGTPPDHGALIFLFVNERAADCARCSRNRSKMSWDTRSPEQADWPNPNPADVRSRHPSKYIWPGDDRRETVWPSSTSSSAGCRYAVAIKKRTWYSYVVSKAAFLAG